MVCRGIVTYGGDIDETDERGIKGIDGGGIYLDR